MAYSGFNPKARWDRHIPQTYENYCPHDLNARIDVLAWFKNGKIYPRIFIWKDKKYKIKKINYNWQERRGQEIISCFSISTAAELYQISFNNTTLSWLLNKII